MNVLIAEDDTAAARLLLQAVTEAGYRADVVRNGDDALKRVASNLSPYDLILLDIMMPGRDGLSVCRTLRADGLRLPILVLTARDDLEDKVAGLDAGADDYLVKPFRIAELLARMRALLRRGGAGDSARTFRPGQVHDNADTLTADDVTLHRATRTASRGERTIPLSVTEFRLLEYLMRHADQVLTRSALLDYVWQYDFGGNDNVLDVYIRYLRGKLDGGSPQTVRPLIHTVRGVGFYFGREIDTLQSSQHPPYGK